MLWLIEKSFFDQQSKSDKRTYGNIRKNATSKGDDYTTGCLLDYPYFKDYYEMMTIDLSKQQALDSDAKAIQQIGLLESKPKRRCNNVFHYWRSNKKLF